MPYSLNKHANDLNVGYWILINKNKVIGISGLYVLPDEPDSNWLAWTGVHPDHRGKGFGRKLIELMIKKSKDSKKKSLKLYTTDQDNEASARALYKKLGFIEVKREKNPEHLGMNIYLELKL